MRRSIIRDKHALLIDEGGVEIPEIRDDHYSVNLLLRVGTTATTGLHWHEKKTGERQATLYVRFCAKLEFADLKYSKSTFRL